jgi:D-alanine transaminase
MAKQAAVEAGSQEAWMIDAQGFVTEGASTTAWIVDEAGKLRTRPLTTDILDGITRKMLLSLIDELKLELDETPFTINEAYSSKEAFSTASSLIVMPIIQIDGHKIGNGSPGQITTQLLQNYKISNS